MDPIQLKTVHGYTVSLNPFLTYDQYIEIQKIWTKDATFDPDKRDSKGEIERPKMGKIPMNIMYEANKLAISYLVIKIIGPNGKEIQRKADSLPIPPKDGEEVVKKIDELNKDAAESFGKKKE